MCHASLNVICILASTDKNKRINPPSYLRRVMTNFITDDKTKMEKRMKPKGGTGWVRGGDTIELIDIDCVC